MPATRSAVLKQRRDNLASQHVSFHFSILVCEDVHSVLLSCFRCGCGTIECIAHPHVGKVHAACAQHVLDVRHGPGEIATGDAGEQHGEEGVTRAGEDEGVVHAGWVGAWRDPGEIREGSASVRRDRSIECNAAGNVEVEVDASEVMEQGVSEDVGTLDVLLVAGVVGKDVRVVLRDEGGRVVVVPHVERPFWVKLLATFYCWLVFAQTCVCSALGEKDLVDDLGSRLFDRYCFC